MSTPKTFDPECVTLPWTYVTVSDSGVWVEDTKLALRTGKPCVVLNACGAFTSRNDMVCYFGWALWNP
jgi:hypothetical protein